MHEKAKHVYDVRQIVQKVELVEFGRVRVRKMAAQVSASRQGRKHQHKQPERVIHRHGSQVHPQLVQLRVQPVRIDHGTEYIRRYAIDAYNRKHKRRHVVYDHLFHVDAQIRSR